MILVPYYKIKFSKLVLQSTKNLSEWSFAHTSARFIKKRPRIMNGKWNESAAVRGFSHFH